MAACEYIDILKKCAKVQQVVGCIYGKCSSIASCHVIHDSRSFDLLKYIQDDLPEQRATRSLPYFAKGPNSFIMDIAK